MWVDICADVAQPKLIEALDQLRHVVKGVRSHLALHVCSVGPGDNLAGLAPDIREDEDYAYEAQ